MWDETTNSNTSDDEVWDEVSYRTDRGSVLINQLFTAGITDAASAEEPHTIGGTQKPAFDLVGPGQQPSSKILQPAFGIGLGCGKRLFSLGRSIFYYPNLPIEYQLGNLMAPYLSLN